jgi:hypothetical protein
MTATLILINNPSTDKTEVHLQGCADIAKKTAKSYNFWLSNRDYLELVKCVYIELAFDNLPENATQTEIISACLEQIEPSQFKVCPCAKGVVKDQVKAFESAALAETVDIEAQKQAIVNAYLSANDALNAEYKIQLTYAQTVRERADKLAAEARTKFDADHLFIIKTMTADLEFLSTPKEA